MINRILEGALKQPFLVVVFAICIVGYGVYSALRLNVDAFPDVTNIQVQINTAAVGLAAVEVEQLITFPIESVMNGLPDVSEVRSISKTGLSVVTVVFHDEVDIYFARQLVLERLQLAKERIPEGLGEPEMGPITTGLGQIYKYILVGRDGAAHLERLARQVSAPHCARCHRRAQFRRRGPAVPSSGESDEPAEV